MSGVTWEDKLKELQEARARVLAQGGPQAIARQHERGKLTARERLEKFLDPGTFVEVMSFVKHRETDFGMAEKEIPADGVVTGYGKVNGRTVCVWSQDFTSNGGTMAEMHGQKVSDIITKFAMQMRVPQVGLMDSGGARLQEGMQAGHMGYGRVINAMVNASGSIPQISLVMGPCGGGQGYLPALTDIVVMTKGKSNMYIGGPAFVKNVTGVDTTIEELGGSKMHATVTGIADMEVENDERCLETGRRLLSYLPASYEAPLPVIEPQDRPDRKCETLTDIVPTDLTKPYDMRKVIKEVVDGGEFLELKRQYAPNAITGFARFNGVPVGLLANQPLVMGGALDVEAGPKMARFIRFCDAFNLPLVFLVDNPAYMPGVDQERGGIIKHGCKHLYAYVEASVPKISVILRKAYAGGYAAMACKTMGADMVFAWPTAVITIVVPEAAIDVIYPAGKYSEEERSRALLEYYNKYAGPWFVAARGYIDDVIRPEETRIKIIQALEGLRNKKTVTPPKKHGNIYL
ncbi:MAG: acyl-CoA carboxylase subunit beta [Clostridia bacterium]|nr:MAG: acyl-CoA carboxylase subunit beta [Clostridia bacterium]